MAFDCLCDSTPYHLYLIFLFRHISNFEEANVEQDVVDGGGEEGEAKIKDDKGDEVFEDEDDANDVLQEEEWFGKYVEHIFEVVGDIDFVFVQAIDFLFVGQGGFLDSSVEV